MEEIMKEYSHNPDRSNTPIFKEWIKEDRKYLKEKDHRGF
jgi:hypothetical protein